MKREGVSTLFIHSYLWALSCLLAHFWNCFVLNVFVVNFESFFEKRLRLGKLCNDSRFGKNVYKVLNFWKYLNGKCWCIWKKCLCFEYEQATKNVSTYSKVFCSSPSLILLSYHLLVRSLIFGCKGTGVGHRIVMITMLWDILAFLLRD